METGSVLYPGLSGRTVVVTGAAGGQGAAEALLLARCGARVIATDLADQAPEIYGETTIEYRSLDVADESSWAALAGSLSGESSIKGLINNAGISYRAGVGDTVLSEWERVIAINLTGPMLGIRALAPLMTTGSSIVNIGSAAGMGAHWSAAYTSSKWGLRGLTRVAANEYGPRGIRVNAVHPGFIETPMTAAAPAGMRDAQLALTPMERTGRPEEVAELAAFLISDAAAYISGADIPVDGAFTATGGVKFMSDAIRTGVST